jgi:hypothetical protein
MLNCDIETKHDKHPHQTASEQLELMAQHKKEAAAKLGQNIVMTGSSISSHPKHDLAEDPHADYNYTVKTYWRPMTPEELIQQAEQQKTG